ncbi:MAG: hypothetical protein ACE5E7_07025 [Anaerolineae bacterium]
MWIRIVFSLPYLTLFLMTILSACSTTPAIQSVDAPPSVFSTPIESETVNITPPSTLTPTVAGYRATLDAQTLSLLEDPLTIRLSPFDTVTINVPVPVFGSVELVPPASQQTLSQPTQCPPSGNPTVLLSQGMGTEAMQAFLNEGGAVTNLEKLLNKRISIQNDYATGYSSARLFHTDVTGDSVPDVLIVSESRFRYYSTRVSLFFFRYHNGQYDGREILSTDGWVFDKPGRGIVSIEDTNGNGTPEITFAWGSLDKIELVVKRYTRTLEWNGRHLVFLANPQ